MNLYLPGFITLRGAGRARTRVFPLKGNVFLERETAISVNYILLETLPFNNFAL